MILCDRCANSKAIMVRKYSGEKLCKDCFIESTRKKVLKDIRKYELIKKGDIVAVALSGGKDSTMVLDILSSLFERKIIDLFAITIDEGIKGYREEGIKIAAKNAKKMGIKHIIVSFKNYFGMTLDEIMKDNPKRGACTYCGVLRRWILNKVARDMGAGKLATGHNLDDEVQSIVMNYLKGNIDNLTRIGPKSTLKHEELVSRVKPLREIPEKEVGLYVVAKDLNAHFDECPYAEESFRAEIGKFIKDLSYKHPTIMHSTLRGFDKIKPVLKREFSKKVKMGRCIKCGEPASHDLCRACIFSAEWEN